MNEPKPLCFVLMPFGEKDDPTGGPPIDFDRIYRDAIAPALEAAGLVSIRADEERGGTLIHRAMFERLLLCEYALADLSTANANVFYELGVRHAARPRTTLSIFAERHRIPFDVNILPAVPYQLGAGNQFGEEQATALRETLTERFKDLRTRRVDETRPDSPIFQLLGEWTAGDLARLKTDVFRDQVRIQEDLKVRLAAARADSEHGLAELDAVRAGLGSLDIDEAGVIVDLLLSYRALSAWDGMISLHGDMPATLKRQVMIREQVAFALNRRACSAGGDLHDQARALEILEGVLAEQGPSAETCGLIGRIHKDRWVAACKESAFAAKAHLRKAIAAYTEGFETDMRDAYPGINAVTLLEIQGSDAAIKERDRLVPVVRYAVERRLHGRTADYWDHATMLELAVLAEDEDAAGEHLGDALATLREGWEAGTTARNLRLIEAARHERGGAPAWVGQVARELEARAS